jgi:DNA-directed RNA polymerase subunit F
MKMDVKKYISFMSNELHSFACEYCGSEFKSFNAQASACPFCNIYSEKSNLELAEDAAFDAAKTLNNAIMQDTDYDIEKIANNILSLKNSPQQIYSLAILYERSSELEHSNKNYNIPGFMEENSDHEERAATQFSRAKGLLYDAIFACNKELSSGESAELQYVKLLAQLEVNDMHNAKTTIEALAKMGARKEMLDYANMLYMIKLNKEDAIKYIEQVIGNGDIMGFYYMSKYLASKGRLKEAELILSNLLSKENIFVAKLLLDKVKKANAEH